ncbi:DNA repair exonuclease [Radiobacillus kanasensis]|uniref:metallophosphoesterase family protein n=1 Tax=Radiobacillus kanasensis TaxID=2844358 RepID=UPI001E5739A5|nr:DNA repair exonuclease [Radiobacillus kanasensis]UFU00474.1 DNA repair exonuclease [Radiobacillus kanasensis]
MITKKITFIHCADLHLDSPFKGLRNMTPAKYKDVQESTFIALSRLVHLAIEQQVDFVLLVGDIFDKEILSLKAQIRFKEAMEQLEQHSIQVFASFGNHDYVEQRSLAVSLPSNVHLFETEDVTFLPFIKNGERIAHIYGFSYEKREVQENKVEEYVQRDGARFHIATLHGSLSTNTEHDVYAPFQLSELVTTSFDYWALGHIHKREVLKAKPAIVYPGNIQGRSKKETGEKGCYLVELDEKNTDLSFYPLQEIRFETSEIDVHECSNLGEIAAKLKHSLQHHVYGKCILTIRFKGYQSSLGEWHRSGEITELIDLENERESFSKADWTHIEGYKTNYYQDPSQQTAEELGFRKEVFRSLHEEIDIQEILKPILQHRQVRKHLDIFTDGEVKELEEAAEELLIDQLTKEG